MKRPGSIVLIVAFGAFVIGAFLYVRRTPEKPSVPPPSADAAPSEFREDFSRPSLDAGRWTVFSSGDFREKSVEVQDGRLRLRAGTIGTDGRTIKLLGLRSNSLLQVGRETRLSASLDWSEQTNGTALGASLVLSAGESDSLRIEYVGVPPGKNGRLIVSCRAAGVDRHLYGEGWPDQNPSGRPLGMLNLELVLKNSGFEFHENGTKIFESPDRVVTFKAAHLVLQMSSAANYPSRQIFFDNIRWTAVP